MTRLCSTFEGTLEYSVANQLNILNPAFIQTIRPINDQVKFIITDRLIGEDGISISYSDLDMSGVFTTTSTKSNINTNAGTVSANSQSYRFGQPVTLTLLAWLSISHAICRGRIGHWTGQIQVQFVLV